jgi:predicted amidohydrolase YtcJ
MGESIEFYNELRANTFSNIDTRRVKQVEDRRRQHEHLKSVMSHFEEMIMSTLREKMLDAIRDGRFYATLYSFTNMDLFEGFKTVFLLKRPYNNRNKQYACGHLFFEQQGIVPLVTRLQTRFDPIDIHTNYDRGTKTHHLMASWKSEN